jgi:hypothetical protein
MFAQVTFPAVTSLALSISARACSTQPTLVRPFTLSSRAYRASGKIELHPFALFLADLMANPGPFSPVRSIIETHILPRASSGSLRLVITHCMRSQWRGPMAADQLRHHPLWPKGVPVLVMEGGWQAWRRKFADRNELFEGLVEQGKKVEVEGVKVVSQDGAKSDGEGWEEEEGEEVEEIHSVELRTKAEREARARRAAGS